LQDELEASRNQGKALNFSSPTFSNFEAARKTQGQFSITVAPLFNLQGGKKDNGLNVQTPDLQSELRFLLALASGSRIKQCACPCKRFFALRTETPRIYYSQRCAQKVTVSDRVKNLRHRQAKWKKAKEELESAMEGARTLYQTTERKALARGEEILKEAEKIFAEAYPREKGFSYEEGKKLIAQASRQIKQLRKRVKGYLV